VLKDIVHVEVLDVHRLRIRFEDGVQGVVSLPELVPLEGVFAPLRDPAAFALARVNSELGTVEWPHGADLDPDVLYELVTAHNAMPRAIN